MQKLIRALVGLMLRASVVLWSMGQVVHAQQFVVNQPDCLIFFHFTAAGQTQPLAPNAGLDNRTTGCTTWNVSYARSGFTSTTVTLESAPNSGGVPGTWVTYAGGTALNGTNPLADAAQSFVWIVGYNPWVRVKLNATNVGSGTVDGAAYGWRIPSASSNGAGSVAANVTIIAPLGQAAMAASIPVAIASNQSPVQVAGTDGSNPQTLKTDTQGQQVVTGQCDNSAVISTSAAGNTRIVTGVLAQQIRICHISFATGTPEGVKLTSGTGATCTSPADLTGVYASISSIALDLMGTLKVPAGADLCVNQVNAQALGGVITYQIF